jgi:hypothetical protein
MRRKTVEAKARKNLTMISSRCISKGLAKIINCWRW